MELYLKKNPLTSPDHSKRAECVQTQAERVETQAPVIILSCSFVHFWCYTVFTVCALTVNTLRSTGHWSRILTDDGNADVVLMTSATSFWRAVVKAGLWTYNQPPTPSANGAKWRQTGGNLSRAEPRPAGEKQHGSDRLRREKTNCIKGIFLFNLNLILVVLANPDSCDTILVSLGEVSKTETNRAGRQVIFDNDNNFKKWSIKGIQTLLLL